MEKSKKYLQYNIKNILIFYNTITIIRHLIHFEDILFIDFFIDFVLFNVIITTILLLLNLMYKVFKVNLED